MLVLGILTFITIVKISQLSLLEKKSAVGAVTIVQSGVHNVILSAPYNFYNFHNCLIQKRGIIKCWSTLSPDHLPKTIKGLEGNVTSLAFFPVYGLHYTKRYIIQNGSLKYWSVEEPEIRIIKNLSSGVTDVKSYYFRTCVIQRGALKCWKDKHGKEPIPLIVKGMEKNVTHISLGVTYYCAIQRGALKCWGNNDHGQLGNGTKNESLIPQTAKGMESGVTNIKIIDETLYVGAELLKHIKTYACAIQRGALKCWGNNDHGQLGNGTKNESLIPQTAKGMESGVTTLSVSDRSVYSSHTCAIQRGAVKCAGDNLHGQLGNEKITKSYSSIFAPVTNLDSDVDFITSSNHYSCAIQRGALKCWGNNNHGQLGNGKTEVGKITIQKPILMALRWMRFTRYFLLIHD